MVHLPSSTIHTLGALCIVILPPVKTCLYCAKQGVSAYRLCKDIGIRGSVLSDLRTGRKQGLSSKTLTLIAEYFGVSIDYLLGKEEAATPKDDRSAKEAQAMDLFSRLSPEEQEIVLAQLRGLTDGR